MTEQEITQQQEENGNRLFYLILVGSFLHAYGHGAFAVARLMGYRVKRKKRKWGEVFMAGFPASRLDAFSQQLSEQGGRLEQTDDKTWTFSGIDGTPDPGMVCESVSAQPPEKTQDWTWLAETVRNYNLATSTPIEAMLFLQKIQMQLCEMYDG